MHKVKSVLVLFFILYLNPALLIANDNIAINHAWISEAPPTVSILAGYLEIENNSNDTQVLLSVKSTEFEHIEIHRSIMRDGLASMEKQNELSIATGETLMLQPGGYHLMLFNPKTPLRAGNSVDLEFSFASGQTIDITAKVEKRSENLQHHHHH